MNGKTQIQIVESQRKDGKITQKVIRSLGVADTDEEIQRMVRIGEEIIVELKNARKPVLSFVDPFDIHRPAKRAVNVDDDVRLMDLLHERNVNDGVIDVLGKTFDSMGLRKIFGSGKKSEEWFNLLKASVIARIACPLSKLATTRYLFEEMALTIPVDRVYRLMDHLSDLEKPIKRAICNKSLSMFGQEVDVLFFDVTTLYFESTQSDELRNFGFSKDCKFKEVQVVLALVTTTDGLPVTYKLYPGNTFEGHTLLDAVRELKAEYRISDILLVADRGMFNKANIDAMEAEGIEYIVAAKLKSQPSAVKGRILTDADFRACLVENDLQWVKEYDHSGRRLIVGYSSKRARKDQSDRTRLIERLLKKAKDGKIKLSELIPNYGTKKFLRIKSGEALINSGKIEEEAKWDGLHGVITNKHNLTPQEILSRYRGLWQIEAAFRVNKHSLKMRPIYHWNESRVRAHILICYLAYAVSKITLCKLKEKGINMSLEQLRLQLNSIESIVLQEIKSKKKFVMPSKLNPAQKQIYRALGITRIQTPFPI